MDTRRVILAVLLALGALSACLDDRGTVLPGETEPPPEGTLWVRLVHLSDPQILDEESPARIVGAELLVPPAWRPQEAYTTQLLDGTIRAINNLHRSGQAVDFAVMTGDATDNSQANEWRWFLEVMDGGALNPLSGVDDRPAIDRPPPHLDPHAPFVAEGLYRQGLHGPLPDIPWYGVVGNHDRFAVGAFPIIDVGELRLAPLPFVYPVSLLFPALLLPTTRLAFGPITPAHPGPPTPLNVATWIPENPERRFLTTAEAIGTHFRTRSTPPGHGFAAGGPSWYSVAPRPGLRLIALDTALPDVPVPSLPHVAGTLSTAQMQFLAEALDLAEQHDEWVIVATHHPSQDLVLLGSPTAPDEFRDLLRRHDRVLAHLAGHFHRHRVIDRGGYLEIETGSILDYPQEARIIEIWNTGPDRVTLRYRMLSHLDATEPTDPLYWLRVAAFDGAVEDAGLASDAVHSQLTAALAERAASAIERRRWMHGDRSDRRGEFAVTRRQHP